MKYGVLVEFYEKLEKTTKRLEKADIISRLLEKCSSDDLNHVPDMVRGRIFPAYDERKIGFSSKLMIRAISQATGASDKEVTSLWKKLGDLGLVSEKLVERKKQRTLASRELSVEKVHENIKKLAELTGEGTVGRKISLVAELLSSAKPSEAKFIVRTILEEMRVGVAEGVLRDAIAKTYHAGSDEVEKAHNLVLDYSEVARMAKEKSLGKASLIPGKPTKVMLAIRVESLDEAFKAVGKPAILEHKYDGFRCLINKKDEKITLFSRRMENVTRQFPDVIESVKKYVKGKSFILDSEVVGYDKKTGKYLPFQMISQRIKRKHDIEKIMSEYPVEVNVFDVIYHDGRNLMKETQEERRKLLEKIITNQKNKIKVTPKLITGDVIKAENFFRESLRAGNEGVMIKNLKATYVPGRRVEGWVKYKPVMEPLDLVIVGAEWGEGKRAKWLSSFDLACRHKDKFLTVGKVGTGIKEKNEGVTFKQLTNELKPYITEIKEKHVWIKPKIVVEVAYEEIQKSPTYESGYALRFPKVLRLRTHDKKAEDANTLEDVERLRRGQKKH